MTSQSPRIYLYKITFEEVPYYYYGVHKEKKYNEKYFGTPITHKWCWELYTPKKQILQLFNFTDEGWLEAQEVEKRLIKTFYNTDRWCLNENVGGIISLRAIRKNIGKKRTEKTKNRISNALIGRTFSEGHKKNISIAKSQPSQIQISKQNARKRLGIPLSEEHKEKLRLSGLGKNKGSLNGNYGKKWYTNGIKNKMAFECPEGFWLGHTNTSSSKKWKLVFENNDVIVVDGLLGWCKDNGYLYSNLKNVERGRIKRHKDIVSVEVVNTF